jgi:RNA polymerase sigma-70 factor (ECF subfamily)
VSVFAGRPDLLARFRAGERAALEEVYWAYVDRVESIVTHGFAKATGASPADVADVVHDTFARAFSDEARRRFDGVRDYAPFLWAIARHALGEFWRRAGRDQPVPDIEALVELAQDAAPEVETIDAPLARAVEDYLAGLPAELSAVHREVYVRGLSQRQAAETLGISRQSLRTLEKRLRKGLASALKRGGLRP